MFDDSAAGQPAKPRGRQFVRTRNVVGRGRAWSHEMHDRTILDAPASVRFGRVSLVILEVHVS